MVEIWKHGWKKDIEPCEWCGNTDSDRFAEAFNTTICMDCLKDKKNPQISIAKAKE